VWRVVRLAHLLRDASFNQAAELADRRRRQPVPANRRRHLALVSAICQDALARGGVMIIGAHSIIYSTDAEADRRFLREVLGFPHVDVGEGWLIFGLPPAEVAVHPVEEGAAHELYLMTDDVAALVTAMTDRGIETTPIANQGWGVLTHVTLPGGSKLGIYQPRHARPPQHVPRRAAKKKTRARRGRQAKVARPRRTRKRAR
jgi:hypothetical protein